MTQKVFDRVDFIVARVRNKRVLDLGCIDHDLFREKKERGLWLHHRISEVTRELVGIDMLEPYITVLRKEGYDIRFGNVEELQAVQIDHREFDVIVAGELIEHLSNPALFLDGVKRFFSGHTRMIITTPNPFTMRMLPETYANRESRGRDDHVCWYSERTLSNLLKLCDFNIDKMCYYSSSIGRNGIRPFLRRVLYRKSPRFADGLIFVCSLRDTGPELAGDHPGNDQVILDL